MCESDKAVSTALVRNRSPIAIFYEERNIISNWGTEPVRFDSYRWHILIFSALFANILPMSPEDKELLKRTLALAEENNDILRSMQRSMRIQRFLSILYWVFIIGSAVGAYYLIQPYIESLTGAYSSVSDIINSYQ